MHFSGILKAIRLVSIVIRYHDIIIIFIDFHNEMKKKEIEINLVVSILVYDNIIVLII